MTEQTLPPGGHPGAVVSGDDTSTSGNLESTTVSDMRSTLTMLAGEINALLSEARPRLVQLARLQIIPGAGHVWHLEKPGLFAEVYRRSLNRWMPSVPQLMQAARPVGSQIIRANHTHEKEAHCWGSQQLAPPESTCQRQKEPV